MRVTILMVVGRNAAAQAPPVAYPKHHVPSAIMGQRKSLIAFTFHRADAGQGFGAARFVAGFPFCNGIL